MSIGQFVSIVMLAVLSYFWLWLARDAKQRGVFKFVWVTLTCLGFVGTLMLVVLLWREVSR